MSENGHGDGGRWAAPGGGRDDEPGAAWPPSDGRQTAPPTAPPTAPTTGTAPSGWGQAPGGWTGQVSGPSTGQGGGWGPAPSGWAGQGGSPQGWFAPPKPGVIPLRPLSVGEVLDGSLQAARRNAKAMIGSSLLFNVVMSLLGVLLLLGFGAPFLRLASMSSSSTTISRSEASSVLASVPLLLLGELVIGLVAIVGGAILQGALVIPVSRAVLDQRTGFRQMWSLVRPRIGSLIGLAFLLAAIGVGGGVALMIVFFVVVAGISASNSSPAGAVVMILLIGAAAGLVAAWLFTRLSVCGAVLVLEKCGPGQALARSWRLTKGNFWRVFGTLLLMGILAWLITAIAGAPLQFAMPLLSGVIAPTGATPGAGAIGLLVTLMVAYLVLSTLAGALSTVFTVGVTALLYVDLRMRREGLDMALMAEHDRLAAGSRPGALPGTA
ncbi:glycerophosphoryl diester phosphodiesterase membrane domain-containing protein [Tersicoccus sp. MR15.9]|uniref:glycerophosphoryl diester phosphodiesterase membrane domain-containing protein n=1 Tax=Tersicoccus mangrovi TaxID=3121635 RepID=UPI002FE5AF11